MIFNNFTEDFFEKACWDIFVKTVTPKVNSESGIKIEPDSGKKVKSIYHNLILKYFR
jgi:hypothetical protein